MEKNEIKIALHPVQTTRASEEIYGQIRRLILDGEIKPGERLPSERKMMEMMQRSRPTIREAMRMLEREGYIKTFPGSSGAVVQEVSVDTAIQSLESIMEFQKLNLQDIVEFRQMTECMAAECAATRRKDDHLTLMADILEKAAVSAGNAEAFIQCDLEFHLAVAEASGNAMFSIMLQVCRGIIGESLADLLNDGNRQEQRDRYRRILDSHREIYRAIAEKDSAHASQVMRDHLTDASADLLDKK